MTTLVTRNPGTRRYRADSGRCARGSTGSFDPVRACRTHRYGMDVPVSPPPVFLTQREVADLLRLPARTLEDWRQTRSGPPYVKLGRHVRYDRDDLLAWVRERRHG